MARAHFVKAARKDNPRAGIKRGESYWWWAFMSGGRGGAKRYSKTQPKPSQLTQSEYIGTVLSIQEDADAQVPGMDDIEALRDEIVGLLEELRDETQSKFDNMPDGLQQGDTGQQLEARAQSVEDVIDELQSIDCEFEETPEEDREPDYDEDKAKEERAEEIWSEVTAALGNIET